MCRERVFRDRIDPFNVSDEELLKHYPFPKQAILEITDLLIDCEPKTRRNHTIPALYQCCIALNFYATGALYSSLQSKFGVSRATISRIIHRVSEHICDNLHIHISFPSGTEMDKIVKDFFDMAKFPNVCGCVDGCQIAIKRPLSHEHIYVTSSNLATNAFNSSTSLTSMFAAKVNTASTCRLSQMPRKGSSPSQSNIRAVHMTRSCFAIPQSNGDWTRELTTNGYWAILVTPTDDSF